MYEVNPSNSDSPNPPAALLMHVREYYIVEGRAHIGISHRRFVSEQFGKNGVLGANVGAKTGPGISAYDDERIFGPGEGSRGGVQVQGLP